MVSLTSEREGTEPFKLGTSRRDCEPEVCRSESSVCKPLDIDALSMIAIDFVCLVVCVDQPFRWSMNWKCEARSDLNGHWHPKNYAGYVKPPKSGM